MAVRTITTKLALDGEAQFKQAMTSVNSALRTLKSELALSEAQFNGQANSMAALAAKGRLLQQQVEQQREKVRALAQAVIDASAAYGEDASITDRYRQQLNRAQADLINMNRELEENTQHLDEARNSADRTTHSLDEFGNQAGQAGSSVDTLAAALQAAGVAKGLKEIADALRACSDASIKFESDIASFNKVAKLEGTELEAVKKSIKELSTVIPAATTEIAQVAEASRRLGVSQESLLEFTQVMVDLGNVSDLSAEAAATALARFANVVGTSADDYERLGSTIVALGNNFATSESEITEMASRLASAGKLAGLTESQIMGLSAAMSSVGIQAEAGGTAMTQTLTAIEKAVTAGGDKLEAFAKIAGMSAQQFSQAWEEDSISAIQAFISGLGALDEQGESATQVLEELGLSGIRQSNMLKSLALASETLSGTLATASQAWNENTELAATAAERYATTEAKLTMASNAANNLKIAIGDALTPVLGAAATAGTAAFSWLAEVAEKYPAAVAAITAVVGVVGLFTAGVTAYTVAANLAAVASGALAAAMNLIPGVAVVTVISGVLAALGTFAAKAAEATAESDKFRESIEQTKETLAESSEEAKGTAEQYQALAKAVLMMAEAGDLSSVQQQALLGMIQELNAAIPGLNLAYDEQTGKLNMTADAVRNLIAAEEERMAQSAGAEAYSQLLAQQAEIAIQLEQAEVELAEARAKNAAARTEEIVNGERVIKLNSDLAVAQGEIALKVGELKKQYNALQEAMDEIEEEYGDLSASTAAAATAMTEAAGTAEALTLDLEALEEATASAADAADVYTSAIAEQEKAGSLSLDTAKELIAAGYESAIVINQETGAVTLNREAYVQVAAAKIQAQLATLEANKADVEAARQAALAEAAATDEANAYHKLAQEKLAAAYADDAQALDLQIAALNRAMGALNSYGTATTKAAKTSSSSSQKIKTQAEQDLAAYTELKAELDHQKAMELVDEKTYYDQLTKYRDQYLTDQANISTWRKVTEQIYNYDEALAAYKTLKSELDHQKSLDLVDEQAYYTQLAQYRDQYLTDQRNLEEYLKVTEELYKYDKSLADQEAALWNEQSDALLNELNERTKAVTAAMDQMENKLSSYGDLYSMEKINGTDKERMNLESLQAQIDAINDYEQALQGLKERNISGSLMDEVLAMDVDSATQYANKLLAMSEQQWEEYNSLWEEKQLRAAEVAEQFYKDQLDTLEAEYTDKLGAALENMFDVSFESGVDTAQGLLDGMASMEGDLYAKAEAIAKNISDTINAALQVPSNAELASMFSGSRIAEQYNGVTAQDLNNATAGVVNGVSTAMMGATSSTASGEGGVYLDSQKVGKILLPGLRLEAKANPEVMDDT